MPANWSLVLNALLLIGVIVTIARLLKTKRGSVNLDASYSPPLMQSVTPSFDDIIAVRKVDADLARQQFGEQVDTQANISAGPVISAVSRSAEEIKPLFVEEPSPSVMMFLLAKENRQLAGYELLQTVLASGLRFGEGNLFHRHQFSNGQGPVLCSLAAATTSGVFDLQNIGAFSVRGLCLFMQASGNTSIDAERFAIMLDTAKQLNEGLDTYLLDDNRRPFTEASMARYHRLLNIGEVCEQPELA